MNENENTVERVKKWLIDNGWHVSPNNRNVEFSDQSCHWYAYRRSSIESRRCECNAEIDQMQVVIYPYWFWTHGMLPMVEVEVTGEYDGIWHKMEAYGIPMKDVPTDMVVIEDRLISAWNALGPTV